MRNGSPHAVFSNTGTRSTAKLDSPDVRLHARILASVAEYETEVRAERVKAGQAVAKANGKRWGGSKPGWRYKVSDDQVAAILEMVANGEKITKVARITGLSRQTVYRILRNRIQESPNATY